MVISLLIGVSMIVVLLAALPTGNIEVEPKVNADLTSLVDFDVVSDDTGTAANGVFFVMRTDDSVGMRLVANLTVDETDEHGVDFFIPAELDIVSVLCSFNGDVSSEHVCIREWPMGGHFIYISKARYYPDRAPVGGDGILEVELALNGGDPSRRDRYVEFRGSCLGYRMGGSSHKHGARNAFIRCGTQKSFASPAVTDGERCRVPYSGYDNFRESSIPDIMKWLRREFGTSS